jgi:RNA polymerase sigma factor (sigma-70 family)
MLRTKFDSEDFVQSVWATFFAHLSQLRKFETHDDMVHFLVRVASNKVVNETRRRLDGEKWNVTREVPIPDRAWSDADIPRSREPSPSELASAKERWENVLSRQPQHYREIFELRVRGEKPEQIARMLNVNVRTVWRAISQIVAAFAAVD